MIHTKSHVNKLAKNYKEMYSAIKDWCKPYASLYSTNYDLNIAMSNDIKGHHLYAMNLILRNMNYLGWTSDDAKNEIHHYKEVCKAYDALIFALENALGMEHESNFERLE